MISDDDFSSIYFSLYRRDRTHHDGGLMVYIKKNLALTSIKSDPCFEIIELLFETNKSKKIDLLACYKSIMNLLVMNLFGSFDDIIIAGDLNYDMSLQHTVLHEFCDSLGFMNVIKKPIRLNPITLALTLLDVILILSFRFFVSFQVINFPMSDFCLSVFNHSSVKYSPIAYTSRFLSKKRLLEFSFLLEKYPWDLYNSSMDPNDR